MEKILTRYGDGTPVEMSVDDIRRDLEEGSEDAAERGRISTLAKDELDHLFDIFSSPHRFIGVEPGKEVVLSYDGSPIKMLRAQVNVDRLQCLQIYEKLFDAQSGVVQSTGRAFSKPFGAYSPGKNRRSHAIL